MQFEEIIDPEGIYQTAEMADFFDVSKQTIRNWAKSDKIPFEETEDGRNFHGKQILKKIESSDFIRQRFRDSQDFEDQQEYATEIENANKELVEQKNELLEEKQELLDELDRKDQRLEKIQDQSFQAINKLVEEISSLRKEIHDVQKKLPDPEEEQDSGPTQTTIVGRVIDWFLGEA